MRLEQGKSFLREALTARQLRVQIWVSESGATKKNSHRWKISKQATPGNITALEDLLFVNTDLLVEPIIMSIKMTTKDKATTIGVAFANTSLREIGVAQFVENDFFSNTESLVIQLSVKECILPMTSAMTDLNYSKLRDMIERCGVVITDRKAVDFNAKNVEQDLNRLLDVETSPATLALAELGWTPAMNATAALLSYLGLLVDDSNYGQYKLRRHDLAQFMKLDASALKALTLMPSVEDLSKTSSLFGLLNKCKTSQGNRMLNAWLRQPLVNLHEIRKRQDLVEAFVNEAILRKVVQEHLGSMPDLHRVSKRLRTGVASLEEIVRVYQTILKLPELSRLLKEVGLQSLYLQRLVKETYTDEFEAYSQSLDKFIEMVEATLDLSDSSSHTYVIKPEYDEGLQQLAKKISDIRDTLDQEHARVGTDLNLELDKRLHLENKDTDAKAIQNDRQYEELKQVKGGIFFRTRVLKEMAEHYSELNIAYQKRQSHLVKEVVKIASTYVPVLESLNTMIAHLDVIVCFSHVSSNAPIPYIRPTLLEKGEGRLLLTEARHPCLEIQDDMDFIPNDVEMSKGTNWTEHGRYVAILPFYFELLRWLGWQVHAQVGVIALMSQVGCFVPCQEAQLPVFDSILARVGAGDSQLKGVSTFMAEMLETANILRMATNDSLVIIDELGRGTSTADGFALAWAISEYIATNIHAFCLFSTHFHELTALAQELPQVKNLHVVAHVAQASEFSENQDITLLYKVEPGKLVRLYMVYCLPTPALGVCDQSFGIHVAELAHFPDSIIKLAKCKATELEDFRGNDSIIIDETEVVNGSKLIMHFLSEWASTAQLEQSEGDDDVVMEDLSTINESKQLKQCFERFRPQIEANRWCRNLLNSL
ncbi:hypothetical protein Clacol_004764 [Clathrus columnatus]|uniref:DNA mismatch repair proteins mutS family domain-containing protein n=1 Tax=Clathrus columnatus TaxID=1419009 RepID=A0AAV5AA02_9AGAM|nr:hypothetical protein Clacol_004764 [Clathrus columnatus]